MMSWPFGIMLSIFCSFALDKYVKRQFGKSKEKYHEKCWFCNKKINTGLEFKGFLGKNAALFF
jgi:hypothetical protein